MTTTNDHTDNPALTKPYREHIIERLRTPEDAAGYLAASLHDNTDCPEATGLVIQDIIAAFGLPLEISTSRAPVAATPKSCGFCGKTEYEVKALIAAPVGYICENCVAICADIVQRNGVAATVNDEACPACGEVKCFDHALRNRAPAPPAQPARDAAEEIAPHLDPYFRLNRDWKDRIAAIISRHFPAARTVAPSANCQCGHDRASHYKQFGPCTHDGCSACAQFIESDNEEAKRLNKSLMR